MARGGARFPHQAGASYIECILPLWGLTRTSQIPLCKVCLSVFTDIRSAPAVSWEGSKPQSFGYPEASYVWGGSHHTLPGSFLSSVKSKCYICSTIFRDCNDSQREFANNFQSFYRFYKLQEGEIDDDMMRYGLRFGVELVQDDRGVLGEFFYDCQGDFKLIPFKGTSDLHATSHIRYVFHMPLSDMVSKIYSRGPTKNRYLSKRQIPSA